VPLGGADRLVGGVDAILVVDDTALPKKGNRSVGVAPQYATTLDKTTNYRTLVSLTLARGEVPAAVRLALFLPETWTSDPHRMTRARVPEDRREARTKLEIAFAQIDRLREGACALAACWPMRVIGRPGPAGPERTSPDRGCRDLGAQQDLSGRRDDDLPRGGPRTTAQASRAGSGLGRSRNDPGRHDRPGGDRVAWHQGSAAGPFLRAARPDGRWSDPADRHERRPAPAGRRGLAGARGVWLGRPQILSYRSPRRRDLKRLAAMIKARWICEQTHRQMTEEPGLDPVEGRSRTGLHRHALMTMMAYAVLQSRRPAATGRKKRIACPPPRPSMPAILDHLSRPSPQRRPQCDAALVKTT